jgi:hypothetical protein
MSWIKCEQHRYQPPPVTVSLRSDGKGKTRSELSIGFSAAARKDFGLAIGERFDIYVGTDEHLGRCRIERNLTSGRQALKGTDEGVAYLETGAYPAGLFVETFPRAPVTLFKRRPDPASGSFEFSFPLEMMAFPLKAEERAAKTTVKAESKPVVHQPTGEQLPDQKLDLPTRFAPDDGRPRDSFGEPIADAEDAEIAPDEKAAGATSQSGERVKPDQADTLTEREIGPGLKASSEAYRAHAETEPQAQAATVIPSGRTPFWTPEKKAEMIAMRINGMTWADIGPQLGCPSGTAAAVLSKMKSNGEISAADLALLYSALPPAKIAQPLQPEPAKPALSPKAAPSPAKPAAAPAGLITSSGQAWSALERAGYRVKSKGGLYRIDGVGSFETKQFIAKANELAV